MSSTSTAPRRALALAAIALLVAVGCSDDSSDSDADATTTTEAATTTEATTTTTTEPQPEASVEASFTEEATSEQAAQAVEVMEARLESAGHPGSTAEVNADGTGLTITVVGVEDPSEATAAVEPLTASGALYFRPVLEGPLAAAEGEQVSPETATIIDQTDPGATLPTSDLPTTPAADDDPDGTSVLTQLDDDGLVMARYQVGPSRVDATAVSESTPTTQNDAPAVQVVMKEGTPGVDQFNTLAEACWGKVEACPTGVYTVVMDDVVLIASVVQPDEATFSPYSTTSVIIWNPLWSQERADSLAAIISAGEMPVALTLA